jgi:hypothetical protein
MTEADGQTLILMLLGSLVAFGVIVGIITKIVWSILLFPVRLVWNVATWPLRKIFS